MNFMTMIVIIVINRAYFYLLTTLAPFSLFLSFSGRTAVTGVPEMTKNKHDTFMIVCLYDYYYREYDFYFGL